MKLSELRRRYLPRPKPEPKPSDPKAELAPFKRWHMPGDRTLVSFIEPEPSVMLPPVPQWVDYTPRLGHIGEPEGRRDRRFTEARERYLSDVRQGIEGTVVEVLRAFVHAVNDGPLAAQIVAELARHLVPFDQVFHGSPDTFNKLSETGHTLFVLKRGDEFRAVTFQEMSGGRHACHIKLRDDRDIHPYGWIDDLRGPGKFTSIDLPTTGGEVELDFGAVDFIRGAP